MAERPNRRGRLDEEEEGAEEERRIKGRAESDSGVKEGAVGRTMKAAGAEESSVEASSNERNYNKNLIEF